VAGIVDGCVTGWTVLYLTRVSCKQALCGFPLTFPLFLFQDAKTREAEARARKAQSERERIAADRASLPIYPYREQLLQAVAEHQVVIIVAETGAGQGMQTDSISITVCLCAWVWVWVWAWA
jgi:hypothetical protein